MTRIILLLSSLLMTMPLMASCSDDEPTPYDENQIFHHQEKQRLWLPISPSPATPMPWLKE